MVKWIIALSLVLIILKKALNTYKVRWQIETLFKAFKSSGFNIEDTHLQKIDRHEKLVMIAFVWCYNIGDYINAIKPIYYYQK